MGIELTTMEEIAVSAARQRVERNPHRNADIQAKTALSLLLGKSKSKRRKALVRHVLATSRSGPLKKGGDTHWVLTPTTH